jgi:hypothetical protein
MVEGCGASRSYWSTNGSIIRRRERDTGNRMRRQEYRHHGPGARIAVETHDSMVLANDGVDLCQPQTGAGVAIFGGEKGLEGA